MNFLLPPNKQRRSFTIIAGFDKDAVDKEAISLAKGNDFYSVYLTSYNISAIAPNLKVDYETGAFIFLAADAETFWPTIYDRESFIVPVNYTLDVVFLTSGSDQEAEYIEKIREHAGHDSLTVVQLPNEKDYK